MAPPRVIDAVPDVAPSPVPVGKIRAALMSAQAADADAGHASRILMEKREAREALRQQAPHQPIDPGLVSAYVEERLQYQLSLTRLTEEIAQLSSMVEGAQAEARTWRTEAEQLSHQARQLQERLPQARQALVDLRTQQARAVREAESQRQMFERSIAGAEASIRSLEAGLRDLVG